MLDSIKGKLVVSCQALADEPLHGSTIMARMALAAQQGGAAAIRCSSLADLQAIMQTISLPVIALTKRHYPDSDIYITPTFADVEELMAARPPMIALDATARKRPGGVGLAELVAQIRKRYPALLLMADIATQQEGLAAAAMGFDCVSTTLCGYTPETAGKTPADDDFALVRQLSQGMALPVIAEGHIATPELAAHSLAAGAWSVVVGGAITRPQDITTRFTQALNQAKLF